MKLLYKKVRVVYDAHCEKYKVEYKNWWFQSWRHDTEFSINPTYGQPDEVAKQRAIQRAENLLNTAVVWQQSNFDYYI